MHLQYALNFLAMAHLFAGDLTTAAQLIDEDRLIAEVTGNPPVGYAAMVLAAWQGQDPLASELIEATSRAATEAVWADWSPSLIMRARFSTTASVATTPPSSPRG